MSYIQVNLSGYSGPKKIIFPAGMLTLMPKSIQIMMAMPQQRNTMRLSVLEQKHADSDILIQEY
jgi:hypothetical protein